MLTGCDADFHKVINVFHFIGLSDSDTDGIHYTQKQIHWLKEQLDAAVAEDHNKPIFVTHYEHNYNTVYGSEPYAGGGVSYFKATLQKYPQVVDFYGHSHYPLNDPRSIWQSGFTAIGTGVLAYTEMTVKDIRIFDPADYYETSTFWIVEVNAEGASAFREWITWPANLLSRESSKTLPTRRTEISLPRRRRLGQPHQYS